jgi:hypothetical protein
MVDRLKHFDGPGFDVGINCVCGHFYVSKQRYRFFVCPKCHWVWDMTPLDPDGRPNDWQKIAIDLFLREKIISP